MRHCTDTDTVIKLFGNTIQLPKGEQVTAVVGEKGSAEEEKESGFESKYKNEENPACVEQNEEKSSLKTNSNAEEQLNEDGDNSNEKQFKRPENILPCPRCNSVDTKFCYFNNYKANQPRHFCKTCQRYWTAGGSMRNVPVGSGRRKSKTSAANQHHRNITIPNLDEKSKGSLATVSNFNDEANCVFQWIHPTPYCTTSFRIPFYPVMGYWGFPWLPPSTSPIGDSSLSAQNSAVLGKRSREVEMSIEGNTEQGDSPKPAMCSVWTTMGYKMDEAEPLKALNANPAALLRSISFRESS